MTESVEARAVRLSTVNETLVNIDTSAGPRSHSEVTSVAVKLFTATRRAATQDAARDVALSALMEYTNERGKHGDHSF